MRPSVAALPALSAARGAALRPRTTRVEQCGPDCLPTRVEERAVPRRAVARWCAVALAAPAANAAAAPREDKRAVPVSTSVDSARDLLRQLDDASKDLEKRTLRPPENITTDPSWTPLTRRNTCWYELAGEWSRMEGEDCLRLGADGRMKPSQ